MINSYFNYISSIEQHCSVSRAIPCLCKPDLDDINTPLENLKSYLLAKYNQRFQLNPKRFEDLVGGVFSDFGYEVRVTSFSGDDGIDIIILDGNSENMIGVQVKRYKNTIEPEQIRSLQGALTLNNLTKGIFVTTSSYTDGAKNTANRYAKMGHPIELWDAEKFYDRLMLSKRNPYDDPNDESAPYYSRWKNTDNLTNYFKSDVEFE